MNREFGVQFGTAEYEWFFLGWMIARVEMAMYYFIIKEYHWWYFIIVWKLSDNLSIFCPILQRSQSIDAKLLLCKLYLNELAKNNINSILP